MALISATQRVFRLSKSMRCSVFQGQARAQTDDFLFIILQIASHQLIAAK